ncbi:MAG: transcriptional regulator [Balneola sp.]|nr:transcriptional regulator [Balneola sp.]MBE78528.1 transcriptional regulator [Balneola sp.]HBX65236.1 transcriptional regulator [Balneolaceae bacterium]|tara:strand:- start:38 stop:388 length:351 start_codon:yes stop_codon:yes gene_type:complete
MNDISYTKWHAMSDKALLKHVGEFVKRHRLEQNKSQKEVAAAAGISRSTLSLLERGEGVTLVSLIQVLRVLDLLHHLETFEVEEKTISPIELAKKDKKKRKRASGSQSQDNQESDW